MAFNFHSSLLKDISLMLNSDDYNVIIRVGKAKNAKEFHAHSNILRACCPYFKNVISADSINNKIMLNEPNITPAVFEMILKYIYTGELNLINQSGVDIFGLLVTSNELLLEELVIYLQDYLIQQQTVWVQQNFALVLNTIFNLPSYKKLQDHCIISICKSLIFFLNDFPSLREDILFYLFEQDDFHANGITVWDCLIKWGINKTPELSKKNNVSRDEWTKKNYEDLKNTLSNFVPLIKFLKINSDDFYDKVQPYESIIPNNIYEEVTKYHLVELSYFVKIESNIIKPKLANIIANWIGKTDLGTKYNLDYKFYLIYRGSQSGINSNSLRSKCKIQLASLVLIKVKHMGKIFGGYSSIGFNSFEDGFYGYPVPDYLHEGCFYYSSDNFIFSFESDEDTRNMKISRVVNKKKAMMDNNLYGFSFGPFSLSMIGQKLFVYSCYDSYEDNLNTNGEFIIEEIEVFIVVKR